MKWKLKSKHYELYLRFLRKMKVKNWVGNQKQGILRNEELYF